MTNFKQEFNVEDDRSHYISLFKNFLFPKILKAGVTLEVYIKQGFENKLKLLEQRFTETDSDKSELKDELS